MPRFARRRRGCRARWTDAGIVANVFSEDDEAIGIVERKRPQQDTFDEREHGGGGANAKGKDEHGGEGESGAFGELASE